MGATTALVPSRWTGFDRWVIIALLISFSMGFPGLGVETREAPNTPLLSVAYSVAFLAPLLAFGASWKWPRLASWAALIGGAVVVALVALDLAGVVAGPPPAAMIVVNVVAGLLAAALAWRGYRRIR